MATWSTEEEDECRRLIDTLDGKLKEKNDQVHELHTALYQSYLIIRNLTVLTFLTTFAFYFFGMSIHSVLAVQTTCLFILIVLFGNFETSGKNKKWFKALKVRATLYRLRQTVQADLDAGDQRQAVTFRDYCEHVKSNFQ
jgi:hypothetical protein